ncbi:16S rRNA (guanine(966)-N(2))-methyltransferase RsmD [Desulfosporosinus meridiei]|uniref:RNA methyltransferase, RsmD family n=1 Tax=Desulfosporosinus meridiei (strain ATCC BAA-275 / DSM 13257 / KCTC 12902 / NCIMB 13706 / S10) TaxID=768704 RepID=J7J2S0_DESMD|nr:16S rRNA (guanine(966)-N(2))-methyltransferase RsmD [Desulfosporosinus meridiei]AFQ45593.1 RNA methyltransferase, RsmD family [Desulfosporosinus meridiei DSM 13257]
MRIIAGEMRGRQLKAVEGIHTRPTSDKVKGAIFSVLGEKVINSRVLDLFAGTGNLAIEALSRGSREAVLVEKNYDAYQVIQRNLSLLGVAGKTKLHLMDAFKFIDRYPNEVFNLIFLDPPYRQELIPRVIQSIKDFAYLTPDGVIVAETAKDEDLTGVIYPFEIRKTGEYGDTKIWYLQRMDV